MRKIDIFRFMLPVVCCGALLSGCTESDFQKYPSDNFTEDGFFVDGRSVDQLLNDAYYSLRGVYQYYYYVADIPSDDSFNSKFNNTTDLITINEATTASDNGAIANLWTNSYTVISRAHIVLERSEEVGNLDPVLKTRYQNEAKFLRALMYFNLVRIFGDVPLVLKDVKTTKELFEYGRESKAKIYTQIIQDLKDAMALPVSYTKNADMGRATSVAAMATLAEVYLTQKEYLSARKVLEDLFALNHGRGLLDNYGDIFDAANPNNEEIVFAAQYARGYDPAMGNPIVAGTFPNEDMVTPIGSGILNRGTGTFLMTSDLYKTFDPADKRVGMIRLMKGTRRNYIFMLKYYDFGMVSKVDSGCDWIVYRWADVLLMYAETLNETGATNLALAPLRDVRTRAGLTTNAALGGDRSAMALAIEKERRMELFCEGHRWFDLVRTGRAMTVINAHYNDPTQDNDERGSGCELEEYKLIFPIPVNQVLLNPDKIKQNPHY